MTHVVFAVRPEERPELLYRLRLEALKQLGATLSPDVRHREHVAAYAERQRMTSRCLWCAWLEAGLLLEQARSAFAAHACPSRRLAA